MHPERTSSSPDFSESAGTPDTDYSWEEKQREHVRDTLFWMTLGNRNRYGPEFPPAEVIYDGTYLRLYAMSVSADSSLPNIVYGGGIEKDKPHAQEPEALQGIKDAFDSASCYQTDTSVRVCGGNYFLVEYKPVRSRIDHTTPVSADQHPMLQDFVAALDAHTSRYGKRAHIIGP